MDAGSFWREIVKFVPIDGICKLRTPGVRHSEDRLPSFLDTSIDMVQYDNA